MSSKKKDFSKAFDAEFNIDDVFGKPKPKRILEETENTAVSTKTIIIADKVEQQNHLESSNSVHNDKKIQEQKNQKITKRKVGRPLIEDEKRDRKFTFNTTQTLANAIINTMSKHNETLRQFGVKLDESKFLEFLVSTHPKMKELLEK